MTGGKLTRFAAIRPSYGGGVYRTKYGKFTMTGGEISDCGAVSGAGVAVTNGGNYNVEVMTMTGGKIYDNISTGSDGGSGIFIGIGKMTMSGGEIYGNQSNGSGGGIQGSNAKIIMTDGKIYRNITQQYGGGVAIIPLLGGESGGSFTMSGGEIYDNTGQEGGGVGVRGTVTMSGGKIYGNSAKTYDGGGASIVGGTFTMSGGEIYGNSTVTMGGGVSLDKNSTGTMYGGTIYGYDAANPDDPNSNKVKDASGAIMDTWGHAVGYNMGLLGISTIHYRYRDSTLEPGTELTTTAGTGWLGKGVKK
jgi:hypothetical protein